MAAELTLGEILGAALAESRPLGMAEQIVLNAVEAAVAEEQRLIDWIDTQAMVGSAWTLASGLAPIINATAEEIYGVLGTVPDNMLDLLKSPSGWAVLAGYVAGQLDRAMPDYRPTIH